MGSNLELACIPNEGNPNALSSSYSYSLCFRSIFETTPPDYSPKCPKECCDLYSSRKESKTLNYYDRGNYWCRVEHDTKEPKMARNSTIRQIDVQCKLYLNMLLL